MYAQLGEFVSSESASSLHIAFRFGRNDCRSNVCRLSATGLGWDRAFGHVFGDHVEGNIDEQYKRWVEIDEKGAVEPVWQAFELFN